MHELSLCQSAVELVIGQIKGRDVKRVTAIWFEAGATACIEEDALRFAFDCVSKDTPLEGAAIHFKVLPALAWCWSCEREVQVTHYGDACPFCQGYRLNLSHEDDLRVKQVEVE